MKKLGDQEFLVCWGEEPLKSTTTTTTPAATDVSKNEKKTII